MSAEPGIAQRRVDGKEGAVALRVRVIAILPFLVNIDRKAAPQPELVSVKIDDQVNLATFLPILDAVAVNKALVELGPPEVGIDPVLA